MGTVDEVKYFECEFHKNSPKYSLGESNCCSFIRYGKIQIGGTTFKEALIERYRPDDILSQDEKERLK